MAQTPSDTSFEASHPLSGTHAELTETERARLSIALKAIEGADPLDYRRQAMGQLNASPSGHLQLTRQDLLEIAALQSILVDRRFMSHRRFLGPIIVKTKQAVHKILNKWLGVSLARQFELNQKIFNLALTLHQMEQRLQTLEAAKKEAQ